MVSAFEPIPVSARRMRVLITHIQGNLPGLPGEVHARGVVISALKKSLIGRADFEPDVRKEQIDSSSRGTARLKILGCSERGEISRVTYSPRPAVDSDSADHPAVA